MESKKGVVCVDRFPACRLGIRCAIDSQPDLTFAGEADGATEGVGLFVGTQAEVLVTEIDVPDKTACLSAVRALTNAVVPHAVVVFTRFTDPTIYHQLVAAGVSGFLNKLSGLDELLNVIRVAARGERELTPPPLDPAPMGRSSTFSPSGTVKLLSAREVEVARLLALGLTVKQVATSLQRSPKTVDAHKSRILSKLRVPDRVGITRWAIREGLVEP